MDGWRCTAKRCYCSTLLLSMPLCTHTVQQHTCSGTERGCNNEQRCNSGLTSHTASEGISPAGQVFEPHAAQCVCAGRAAPHQCAAAPPCDAQPVCVAAGWPLCKENTHTHTQPEVSITICFFSQDVLLLHISHMWDDIGTRAQHVWDYIGFSVLNVRACGVCGHDSPAPERARAC
jgi:hypothetical protein